MVEELEELLIGADFGMTTTIQLMKKVRERTKRENLKDAEEVKRLLREEISAILRTEDCRLRMAPSSPTVYLFLGVNGVGKTTTIGKLAKRYKGEGKNVLLAAGDTFRAAAIEQLQAWGDRTGVQVIRHQHGADPSAVVFDAISAAKARGVDILMIDTAGRLHNKEHLMEELRKICRVASRELPGCPHETLLVLDGVAAVANDVAVDAASIADARFAFDAARRGEQGHLGARRAPRASRRRWGRASRSCSRSSVCSSCAARCSCSSPCSCSWLPVRSAPWCSHMTRLQMRMIASMSCETKSTVSPSRPSSETFCRQRSWNA